MGNAFTTNKFHVRPDIRGMREKILNAEQAGDHNHGYMSIEDTQLLWGKGSTDPKSLYVGGFQNATTPTLTQDEGEHKTGLQKYAQKFGTGNSTLDNLTMEQLVVSTQPYFAKLMFRAMEGGATRMDLIVVHFDLGLFKNGASMMRRSEALEKYAMIYLYEGCIPTSVKPDGDLDATGGDIAVGELEFAPSDLKIYYPRWNEQAQDFESVLMGTSFKLEDDIAVVV